MNTVLKVKNANGRGWSVRLLRKGDNYGLNDVLTVNQEEPLVEFYDATYANDARFDVGLGQFVSRYYATSLAESAGGLNLDGGVAVWFVDADAMTEVREWIMNEVGMSEMLGYADADDWGV